MPAFPPEEPDVHSPRLSALRASPPFTHEALSAALQAKGDRDGAFDEIREAIRLNPDESAYRKQLSALLKSQRESTMPLQETFWAKRFGMLVDQFGIAWMVNCEKPM